MQKKEEEEDTVNISLYLYKKNKRTIDTRKLYQN